MLTLLISLILTVLPSPHFHHKGMESGLSQLTINGLYQDEYGVLWVGTKEGVKYYEGTAFHPLTLPDQNSWVMSNRVPTLCGDGNGSIFINMDYSVVRYDLVNDQSETLFSQTHTASPPDISIHHGSQGLWIGCADRIYLWNSGSGLQTHSRLARAGSSISALLEADGKLYIGTKKDGLFRINLATGEEATVLPPSSEIITLYADTAGRIWGGTFEHGIFCLEGETISSFTTGGSPALSSNYIRAFSEDDTGCIWAGTARGIDVLNSHEKTVEHIGLSSQGRNGLSNLSVWCLLKDRQGTMWIGSYYGGLDYCTFSPEAFSFENFGLAGGNGYPVISDAVADRTGTMWLSTESNGLIRYDGSSWRFLREFPFSRYNIKDLLLEKDSTTLWVSTHMGGLWRYNTRSGQCKHFSINDKDMTARSESLLGVAQYGRHLLVGTLQGVYWLDPDSGQIDPVPEVNRYIYEADRIHVCADSLSIWIAGNTLCCYHPGNGVVKDYSGQLEELTGGGPVTLIALAETRDGEIYVGTAGAGLLAFDRSRDRFTRVLPRKSSFPSAYISCIHPLSDGRLLLGTNKGLCQYDPATGFVFVMDQNNGFPLISMLPGCIAVHRDQLLLGGVNGLSSTTEKQLQSMYQPHGLFFSRMDVNGQPVRPGDASGILSENLRFKSGISLSHKQKDISLYVGTDSPARADQVSYLYFLKGYDKDWTLHTLKDPIHYDHVPPGSYELLVNQIASLDETSLRLHIRIRPPFWAAWYAWLLYALLLASLVSFVFYFFLTKFKLTTTLAMERKNQAETEKLNQQKLRFFANMSHELRTPLTLLLGHLELFRISAHLGAEQEKELATIQETAQGMVGMVSDQLDFIKMEENSFRVRLQSGDLVTFVRKMVDDFQVMARQKVIRLTFSSEQQRCAVSFDEEHLKKVFYNLLSNAFKYTPAGSGKIDVHIGQVRDGEVPVRVRDNGIGIDAASVGKVFDRFYQSDNKINRDPSVTGTGIGLSVAWGIVSQHGGRIELESKEHVGSTFTVVLPVAESDAPTAEDPASVSPPVAGELPEQKSGPKKKLLLVEDDLSLRRMLVQVFAPLFEVYDVADGKAGLEMAEQESPDLIISDIMMPVMTGDEFCRRIKSNFATSHIPVILLTALADVQDSIHGFNCGADDYITKPFNISLLIARCMGLLNNRALLQKRFSLAEHADPQLLSENSEDVAFMDKLMSLIEDNIFDKNVSVSYLSEQMAMGHTKFFNKVKGLTGSAPKELILSVKIKYAAKMLRERKNLNVSDIAYQLGYSSLNYFGKCFKEAYGVSPSAYRKDHMPEQD